MIHARPRDRHAADQAPGMRIPEVQAVPAFRDDDRLAAVRCVVEIVRIGDRDGGDRFAAARVELGQDARPGVVDVEVDKIPGRHNVMRDPAGAVASDDGVGMRINDGHRAVEAVRNVKHARGPAHSRAEASHLRREIDVPPYTGRWGGTGRAVRTRVSPASSADGLAGRTPMPWTADAMMMPAATTHRRYFITVFGERRSGDESSVPRSSSGWAPAQVCAGARSTQVRGRRFAASASRPFARNLPRAGVATGCGAPRSTHSPAHVR